jgi:hypothetical protein
VLLEPQPRSIGQAWLDLGDALADRSELISTVAGLKECFGRGTVG